MQPLAFIHALLSTSEPNGFLSTTKDHAWLAIKEVEITLLLRNDTWALVPRPPNTSIVGFKWVFGTTYHYDGSIDYFKAHLIAKSYT